MGRLSIAGDDLDSEGRSHIVSPLSVYCLLCTQMGGFSGGFFNTAQYPST